MIELTEATFADIESTEGIAVVQFTAPWCGPCRMIAPVLTELENEGKISYYKLDIDANPEVARDNLIMSIPTLYFYKNGNHVQTTVGVQRKAQLEAVLEAL